MLGNLLPLTTAPTHEVELLDSTWMDDLAMLLQAGNSHELLTRTTTGAATLLDSCLEHALLPNLGRGKTEALLSFRSTGTRKAQYWLFVEEGGTLPLHCRLWPHARLRVTPTYKHLGGLLHRQGCLHKEVKARAAMAWSAFNQRKKQVFASPKISWPDKMVLFDSLVSTVMFYGSGKWPSPPEACKQSLRGALRGMACQMLRPLYTVHEAWHLGTDWVFALLAMPSVDTYLHVHRLRYLLSCISLETREIWALAHWEQRWLAAVADSVEWLWSHTDRGRAYATWGEAWTVWRDEARASPQMEESAPSGPAECRSKGALGSHCAAAPGSPVPTAPAGRSIADDGLAADASY